MSAALMVGVGIHKGAMSVTVFLVMMEMDSFAPVLTNGG